MKNIYPAEHDEQVRLVNWMTMKGIVFTAIPNGARTNMTQALKLKREGLQKGFPDLLIFNIDSTFYEKPNMDLLIEYPGIATEVSRSNYGLTLGRVIALDARGIAIEMKRKKGGVQSKEQKEWQKKLEDCGWIYILGKGYEDARSKLEELGY